MDQESDAGGDEMSLFPTEITIVHLVLPTKAVLIWNSQMTEIDKTLF